MLDLSLQQKELQRHSLHIPTWFKIVEECYMILHVETEFEISKSFWADLRYDQAHYEMFFPRCVNWLVACSIFFKWSMVNTHVLDHPEVAFTLVVI